MLAHFHSAFSLYVDSPTSEPQSIYGTASLAQTKANIDWTHKPTAVHLFSVNGDDAVHVGGHVPRQDHSNVSVNDFCQVTDLIHTTHHHNQTNQVKSINQFQSKFIQIFVAFRNKSERCRAGGEQKRKGKEEYLYSAIYTTQSQSPQTWITQF